MVHYLIGRHCERLVVFVDTFVVVIVIRLSVFNIVIFIGLSVFNVVIIITTQTNPALGSFPTCARYSRNLELSCLCHAYCLNTELPKPSSKCCLSCRGAIAGPSLGQVTVQSVHSVQFRCQMIS